MNGKRHRRLVEMDGVMTGWVVLAGMTSMYWRNEVQVRGTDWRNRRWGRCIWLYRCDLGL